MKYCYKGLNQQSSEVRERINPFYINSYGKMVSVFEQIGFRTAFRNALCSTTEVPLYMVIMPIEKWSGCQADYCVMVVYIDDKYYNKYHVTLPFGLTY